MDPSKIIAIPFVAFELYLNDNALELELYR